MSSSVAGGAGGISANLADIEALAGFFDTSADDLRSQGMRLAPLALDPAMLGAALLCPASAATAEAAMNLPVVGPRGMLWLGLQTEAYARLMRAVVTGYRNVDKAQTWVTDVEQWATGFVVGLAAPVLVPVAVVVALGDVVVNDPLVALKILATGHMSKDETNTLLKHLGEDVDRLVVKHPGIVETMVGGSAGLVNGVETWLPPSLQRRVPHPGGFDDAVDALSGHFPDGTPRVDPGGETRPSDAHAPESVADLLRGVDRRQERGAGKAVPGEVGVQRVVGADGKVRWIVQLPGTEVWPMKPGERLRDTGTNLHITGGDMSTYEKGVLDAMRRSGIGKNDEVMLVGHSQGGMVAGRMASQPKVLDVFRITHVVTAGAPIGRDHINPRVQVLALEGSHDIVPQLDGRANPDRANVTTVTFNDQKGTVGTNHALDEYQRRAEGLLKPPLQTNPSVAAWNRSARNFLPGSSKASSASTQTWAISRKTQQ